MFKVKIKRTIKNPVFLEGVYAYHPCCRGAAYLEHHTQHMRIATRSSLGADGFYSLGYRLCLKLKIR